MKWQLFLLRTVDGLRCAGWTRLERAGELSPLKECRKTALHTATIRCRTCGEQEFHLCEYGLSMVLQAVAVEDEAEDAVYAYAAHCGHEIDVHHEVLSVQRVKAMEVIFSRSDPEHSLKEALERFDRMPCQPDIGPEESEGDPPF